MASIMYARHDEQLLAFAAYTAENGATYGFTAEQITEVGAETINWTSAYNDYKDPAKATSIVIEIVRRRFDETNKLLRFHRQRIKKSGINLPAEAIAAFGIHTDAIPRGRVPIPPIAPDSVVEHLMHLVARIYTFDPRQGSEKHLGKPVDVTAIVRYIAYNNPGDPTPGVSLAMLSKAPGIRFMIFIIRKINTG